MLPELHSQTSSSFSDVEYVTPTARDVVNELMILIKQNIAIKESLYKYSRKTPRRFWPLARYDKVNR